MRDPTVGLEHIDLLYPARRRYRGVYENCRLATVERRVLNIVREDDLPGSEAPAAWLTYLRGGSAANLRRVAAHNHQDVVTLARLLLHFDSADNGATTAPCDAPTEAGFDASAATLRSTPVRGHCERRPTQEG